LSGVLGQLLAQSGETAIGGMQQTLKESSRWRKQQTQRWRRQVLAAGIALLVGLGLFLLLINWLMGSKQRSPAQPPRPERSSLPPQSSERGSLPPNVDDCVEL